MEAFLLLRRSAGRGALLAFLGCALAVPQLARAQEPASNFGQPFAQPGGDDAPDAGGFRRNQPIAPVAPSSPTKSALALSAYFAEGGPMIGSGLRWRIFADQADLNGNYALVADTNDARPLLTLDPGGYVVHIAYGLSTATRHVVLGSSAKSEHVALNTGAIRFSATVEKHPIPNRELSFELQRADDPAAQPITEGIKTGEIVRLPAGSYQLTSTYGRANARIVSEVRVDPGKLTDASVIHKAAHVAFELLGEVQAEDEDTFWSIQTPGGDVVVEGSADKPNYVLAEGDYVAVARRGERNFQKAFSVESGHDARVELSGS